MTTTERTTITLTSTGRRRTVRDTTIHSYVQEDGTQRLFAKRLYPCSVGGQFTIEATPDLAQVFPGTTKYTGRVDRDDPRLAEWAAEDEYAEQDAARKAAERKALAHDPLEALLGDLRKVSTGLNKPQRRALASRLMEALYL